MDAKKFQKAINEKLPSCGCGCGGTHNPGQPLIVKDPKQRAVTTSMCPRCKGKLWTDLDLSKEESATILVCETCGIAYDLLPIFR